MTEIKVNISDLKSEGKDLIEELAEFLNEKTDAEVKAVTDEILVKGKEGKVSRKYLRVLLRKFLYKQELTGLFRVIGGRGNSWVVKEKRIFSEE